MRNHRMHGYGAWCQGWRDGERHQPKPPHQPGILFWSFVTLVLVVCVQVALQGQPFAIVIGLAIIAGALKGLN